MTNNKIHIKNLDAVRGWAALIVCFSHIPPMTQPSFGAAGVWIFFVLSGFLLSINFENSPARQVTQKIPAYLLRRLFRILPVYCFVIAVYALVYKYFHTDYYTNWAISHLSFQKADGHFWSVKVELIFYLVLPFILLGLSFLKNKKQKLIVLFLLSGVVYYFFEAKGMMAITAGDGQVKLYFAPFILGVLISVIRNDLPAKLYSILFHIGAFLILFLCLDINILETSIFRSGFESVNNLGWNYSFLFYPISCIIIIGAYKGSSCLLRVPFIQSVGRCGYSFYLWHMVIIVLLSGFITNKPLLFFSAMTATYLISMVTYQYIELPFINFAKLKNQPKNGLISENVHKIWTSIKQHKMLVATLVLLFVARYLFTPSFLGPNGEMCLLILVTAYLTGFLALGEMRRSKFVIIKWTAPLFLGYMLFFAMFYGHKNISRIKILNERAIQQAEKAVQEAHEAQVAAWKKAAQPVPGFNKEYYLATRLAKLQAEDSSWIGKDTASLDATFKDSGLTAKGHYNLYGYLEGLNPNQYFNRNEYLLAKARAMYLAGGYASIEMAKQAFKATWPQDLYQHYIKHGAAQGINPSNLFDESAYLSDKLASLRAEGKDQGIKSIDELRELFASLGITALSHYCQFGIAEGLSATPVSASASASASAPASSNG